MMVEHTGVVLQYFEIENKQLHVWFTSNTAVCYHILHSYVQISLQGKMATGASTNISIGKLLGVMHSVKYHTYQ